MLHSHWAVVAQKEERVDIDDIELYVFKNGNPAETDTYIGDAMEMTGEGRPLWSIVTWPSEKWEEIDASKDLEEWAKNFKIADNNSTVGNLNKYFL